MDLRKIKSISSKNIDRLIDENLYRGFATEGDAIHVQCMNKDIHITFYFALGSAWIENRTWDGPRWDRAVNICDKSPKYLYDRIEKATC